MFDPATCPTGEVVTGAVADVATLAALAELLCTTVAEHYVMNGALCASRPKLSAETTRGGGHEERTEIFLHALEPVGLRPICSSKSARGWRRRRRVGQTCRRRRDER
jgi:hypothetical protein